MADGMLKKNRVVILSKNLVVITPLRVRNSRSEKEAVLKLESGVPSYVCHRSFFLFNRQMCILFNGTRREIHAHFVIYGVNIISQRPLAQLNSKINQNDCR